MKESQLYLIGTWIFAAATISTEENKITLFTIMVFFAILTVIYTTNSNE